MKTIFALELLLALFPANGAGPMIKGKEITCYDATYIKPALAGFNATFQNYQSCDEATQKYTVVVDGLEVEMQAGQIDNSHGYTSGTMCASNAMYFIYATDGKESTWDALKASPPDESQVLLKCPIKEVLPVGATATGDDSDGMPILFAVMWPQAVLAVVSFALLAVVVFAMWRKHTMQESDDESEQSDGSESESE